MRGELKGVGEKLLGANARPVWGIVLGSGFSAWAGKLEGPRSIPYGEVEGVPEVSVIGHEGRFVGGRVGNVQVVMASGRVHLYEGKSPQEVVRAVEVLAGLGAKNILLTAAVGALFAGFAVGEGLCVCDQINMTGQDPATGTGAFPDASAIYDAQYCAKLREAGLASVVLAGVRGPSYETPAEVRALRALGAEAVCMSTVLEALAARSLGLRTAAVAVVANRAGTHGIDHAAIVRKVEQAAENIWPAVAGLIAGS